MTAPLYADRRMIVATVRGSMAHRAAEVAALLDKVLADAERRALRGPKNSRGYSEKVEQGIRAAVVAVPVGSKPIGAWRGLIAHVIRRIERLGPETFGLRNVPDRNVVGRIIRQMDAERRRESA